jgi:hypothetical protein
MDNSDGIVDEGCPTGAAGFGDKSPTILPQLGVNKTRKHWIILRSNDIYGFVGDFVSLPSVKYCFCFLSSFWLFGLLFFASGPKRKPGN